LSTIFQSQRAAAVTALAAGALTVLGFAPIGLWPIPLLTLAALWMLWRRAATPGNAFVQGFAFGAGLFGAGVSWVYVSLHDFGLMPAPIAAFATLAFCAVLSLYPAAAGWCFARLRLRLPLAAAAGFAALWVLAEWLRGWVFTGFPWLAVGYSQSDSLLSGFASLAGVFAVSAATALCAALLGVLVSDKRKGRIANLAALALGLVFAIGGAAQKTSWTAPQGQPVTVALLQGNIPQDLKFQPERYFATLATYRRLIDASNARLIVLPETAIPVFLDAVDPEYLKSIAQSAMARNADIIVGAPLREPGGGFFNSVVTLGASPSQRYDKSHLVPFGEFVPAGFGWVVKTLSIPLSDFTPGTPAPKPLALAGQIVAPDICYEDAFGEEIIRQLPQATLLVNVSNVAWFGDSLAPAQHLQMSRMRAMETERFMLRATNTGVTAIVDPRGKVVGRLPQFTEGLLRGEVQGRSGATPYVRFGNVPIVLICLALLAAVAFHARRSVGAAGESR
jgi:apolipoprotein N-acyltransferase